MNNLNNYISDIKDICRDIEEDNDLYLDVDISEFSKSSIFLNFTWTKCIGIEFLKKVEFRKIINDIKRIKTFTDYHELSMIFIEGSGSQYDTNEHSYDDVMNFFEEWESKNNVDLIIPSTLFLNNIDTIIIYKEDKKFEENKNIKKMKYLKIYEEFDSQGYESHWDKFQQWLSQKDFDIYDGSGDLKTKFLEITNDDDLSVEEKSNEIAAYIDEKWDLYDGYIDVIDYLELLFMDEV